MMEQQMFCFQCEQTAGCAGCTGKAGVCGKSADLAKLQDELTGALVGLARAAEGQTDPGEGTWKLIIEGLFATVTNVNFDEAFIRGLMEQIHGEKDGWCRNVADAGMPADGMTTTIWSCFGAPMKISVH